MKQAGWCKRFGLATALVVGGLGLPALAQYRVGDQGHARDANNQVGSGGYNGATQQQVVTGNMVVTGNVTGGLYFRGYVPYTDPNAFRVLTPGTGIDDFIRDSSGVPQRGVPSQYTTPGQPQPYYGTFSGSTPTNQGQYVQVPGGSGYIPQLPPTVGSYDGRLGDISNTPIVTLPAPGEMILPGPVDPSRSASLLSATPGYGMDQLATDQAGAADPYFQSGYVTFRRSAIAPRQQLDNASIQKLRDELKQTIVPDSQQANPANPAGQPAVPGQPPVANPAYPMNAAMQGALPASAIVQAPLSGALPSGMISTTGAQTSQSIRQVLETPAQQSTQYMELQQRLEALNNHQPLNDEEANRLFLEQWRAQQAAQAAHTASANAPLAPGATATPGTPEPDGSGAASAGPSGAQKLPVPEASQKSQAELDKLNHPIGSGSQSAAAEKPEPLRISSLAAGVQNNDLGNALREAENQTRQGKFLLALDAYDDAEQIAPNNPLIWLGRANAELGASFYARAEMHLRQAFGRDPALMMGQVDLKQLLGQQRLDLVIQDLKDISTNTKEARPLFLLGYIYYNIGQERKAEAYLDLAEKRAGPNDPLYPQLRQHWALPTTQPAQPELNK